jgi:hypothetical protein
VLYFLVQAGAITILFTGGNTSFSGFPFLTSFVAEDSFLPRWLSKRGHRLVFSSGIIVLTVLALALLLAVGANTNNLVPFYAIGVFTGFSMAGFGMARYHRRTKEPGWRRRLVINFTAGVYTALVVVIFAIVKFTEGAWLVVAVFPVMVFLLIRLNRQYRTEAGVVEALSAGKPPDPPNFTRRTVLVLVDDFDLAAIAALRYARSLHPTALRAVHFVIDQQRADHLLQQWPRANRGIPLDLVDCPHRRIERAAGELVAKEACQPDTYLTVLLPRRSTRPLLGRLLHDRTADKIAGVVSRIPRSAAMIIPFDVTARIEVLHEPQASPNGTAKPAQTKSANGGHHRAAGPPGVIPISSLTSYRRATVAGRVHTVEFRPVAGSSVLACTVADTSGELTALFYGRTHITGLHPGSNVQFRGTVGITSTGTVMINPAYELLD